ncbi:MAG: hypothetical protein II743_03285 [Lachnospiraceae bacterium]|nr:hypothetical protein [Lachnospiraceae bacterium]
MTCPKCGSAYVNVQMINEAKLRNVHHSIFWWIFVGWWWIPVKWLCFTVPALIFKIFGHKKQKIVNNIKTVCVCQNCGYSWRIK